MCIDMSTLQYAKVAIFILVARLLIENEPRVGGKLA